MEEPDCGRLAQTTLLVDAVGRFVEVTVRKDLLSTDPVEIDEQRIIRTMHGSCDNSRLITELWTKPPSQAV